MVPRMAARLIIASLFISACSSAGAGNLSRPPGNQAPTGISGGSTTGGDGVVRKFGPQKASAERRLDSKDGRSITAFIRDDASEDAVYDLGVSVGKMQGVDSAEITYATGTIEVFLLSSARSEEARRIRDYLLSSSLVVRVE